MTKLLSHAFKVASDLPEDKQDAYAKWLLDEIQSDNSWDRSFEKSQDILGDLSREAIDDFNNGRTKSLNFD